MGGSRVTHDRLLLRMDEAAEVLGVSRSQVYALAARRELPVVTLGRSRRIPVAALRAWIEEQTNGHRAPTAA